MDDDVVPDLDVGLEPDRAAELHRRCHTRSLGRRRVEVTESGAQRQLGIRNADDGGGALDVQIGWEEHRSGLAPLDGASVLFARHEG